MDEEQRYHAVAAQIADLLGNAANDRTPGGMVGLGSVWLAAEMYCRNEQAHDAHRARVDILTVLEWRIVQLARRWGKEESRESN